MDLIKIEKIDSNIIIINILSTIENKNISKFKQELLNIVDEGPYKYIIDFSKVAFLNSLAIGIIAEFVKRAKLNKQLVAMVNLDKKIIYLFKLLNLHKVFDIDKTRDEAIEFLSQ